MAGFSASAAADTRQGYARGQVKHSSGQNRAYKSGNKARGRKVHKHAHKNARHGKAPKYAKQGHGSKRHAYKKHIRKYHGPKHAHGPVHKHYGGKPYAYKKPVRKYHGGSKHGHGPVYKYKGGYPKVHSGFYIGRPFVKYGWAPIYPTRHYYRRNCHPVNKIGYTRNGHKVKFGGTMCYDKYGYGYIVNGSRHIIHYY